MALRRRTLLLLRRQFEINATGCLINRTFMSVNVLRFLVTTALHVGFTVSKVERFSHSDAIAALVCLYIFLVRLWRTTLAFKRWLT